MPKKELEQITQEIQSTISTTTDVTDFREGSLAGAFVKGVGEQIANLYIYADTIQQLASPSTATGPYLDRIGLGFNTPRLAYETDQNYRYRIISALQQKYTRESIRVQCLVIDGVKDIFLKEFPRGFGSYDLYVVSNEPITSDALIASVQTVLNQHSPYGIDARAQKPIGVPIDIKVSVALKSGIPASRRPVVLYDVKSAIRNYLDNIQIAGTMQPLELLAAAAKGDIAQLNVQSLKVNGKSVYLMPLQAAWNQKFYAGTVEVV